MPKATDRKLDNQTARSEVERLPTIDWQQVYLTARLKPGQRLLAMARASAFARGILRGAFRRRFPDHSLAEINMLVLEYTRHHAKD